MMFVTGLWVTKNDAVAECSHSCHSTWFMSCSWHFAVNAFYSLFTAPTWTRQDCLVSSVSALWTQLATRQNYLILLPVVFTLLTQTKQDKIVLSCLNPVSSFQVFSKPQHIWDWTVANGKLRRDETKLPCLVCSCVHTAEVNKTRQDSFVLSVSAVWTSCYCLHGMLFKPKHYLVSLCSLMSLYINPFKSQILLTVLDARVTEN